MTIGVAAILGSPVLSKINTLFGRRWMIGVIFASAFVFYCFSAGARHWTWMVFAAAASYAVQEAGFLVMIASIIQTIQDPADWDYSFGA